MATPWRLARSMTGPYNGGQWARSLAGRRYHSEAHEPPPGPFSLAEKMILNASLPHVPAHGFTDKALVMGAKDVGYLDASINLFSRRAFDLVHHHLVTHRLALKDVAHHHWPAHGGSRGLGDGSDIASRVRRLTWERLMASRAVIHQWQDVSEPLARAQIRPREADGTSRRWPSWPNPPTSRRPWPNWPGSRTKSGIWPATRAPTQAGTRKEPVCRPSTRAQVRWSTGISAHDGITS